MSQLDIKTADGSVLAGIGMNRHKEREGLRVFLQGHKTPDRPLIVSAVRLCNYDRIIAAIGRTDKTLIINLVAARLKERGIDAVFHVGAGRLAFVQACSLLQAIAFLDAFLAELKCDIRLATSRVLPVFVLAYVEWSGGSRSACDRTLQQLMFALIQTGRPENAVVRFEETEWRRAREEFERDAECARAFRESQFCLHFQPIVAVDRSLIGAEGLLRWDHPTLGLLSPGTFIATVEESDLFNDFGFWTIEQACLAMRQWSAQGLERITTSINLTANDLLQPDFLDRASAIVREFGLTADRMQLELTERVPLDEAGRALRVLERLKHAGFRLALDDFGTGLSDLQHLQHGLFETLKIDKAFIETIDGSAGSQGLSARGLSGRDRFGGARRVGMSRRAAAIYATLVDLADRLDLQLIAEGVETEPQFDYLVAIGVTRFQGFLFGKAEPPEMLQRFDGPRR